MSKRFIKFSTIGGIGIGTNYACLYLLAFLASTDIKNMAVVVVSGIMNTLANYIANHLWTFRDRRANNNMSLSGIKFFIVTAFTTAVYALLVWGFNNAGLDPRLSILVALFMSFIPKYILCYLWVWRNPVLITPKGVI